MPSSPPPSPLDGLTDLARRHRRVAMVGPTGSGLTTRLIAHHQALLDDGVPAATILALAGPGDLDRWRSGQPSGPAIAATTFAGWLRRELETFWPLVEASGGLPPAGPRRHGRMVDFASPAMAKYRMARATAPLREAENWAGRLRARSASQISQLLETLAIAVDHRLALDQAAERLASAWVGSDGAKACRGQIAVALGAYCDWALRHRVLDAALQREVYLRCLWPLPAYRDVLVRRVRHLVVDEWNQTTPLAQTVLRLLADQVDTVVVASASDLDFIQADGADPEGTLGLTAHWHTLTLTESASPAPLVALGTTLVENLSGGRPATVDPEDRLVARMEFSTRPAMFRAALQDLGGLLAGGVSPTAIALVLPTLDRFGLAWLTAELQRQGVPHRLMVPAVPLTDALGVQVLCTLARRLYTGDWRSAGGQKLQALVETLLGLDPLSALPVAQNMSTEPADLDTWPPHQQAAWGRLTGIQDRYRSTGPWTLDHTLRLAFQDLWAQAQDKADAEPIAQLIALAEEFQACAVGPEGWSTEEGARQFLDFLDTGALFVRPNSEEGVLIAPGYAYARSGPPVDFQFWLDLGSASWRWPLRRELCDATVLSADWTGELDTPETEEFLSDFRLGRAWRTMLLKARKAVRWYSSDLDEEGREQNGGMVSAWERLLGSRYAGLEATP